MSNQLQDAFLRLKDVRKFTGLSKSSLYRLEKSGEFPKRIAITPGTVGWRVSDLSAWMAERSPKVV